MSVKEYILTFALFAGGIMITWFVRGCVDEKDFTRRIETAPASITHHETEKPVVLPQLPATMRKSYFVTLVVNDTAVVQEAIDSVSKIYNDSLATMKALLMNHRYEYADTAKGFYMALNAMTPFPPVIVDIRIKPVKCDSVVITKLVPVEPDIPWYDHWYIPIVGELLITSAYILAAPK